MDSSALDADFIEELQTYIIPTAIGYLSSFLKVIRAEVGFTIDNVDICDINPATSINNDYNDVDLLIFVTAEENTSEGYIAVAWPCYLDPTIENRPIIGAVQLNSVEFLPGSSYDWESQVGILLHEITHVLGFNDALFDYFPN